jgi:hypothetical protein
MGLMSAVVLVSACDSGEAEVRGADPRPTLVEGVESIQSNGRPRELKLDEGIGSSTYAIEALDPVTHTITVRLKAAGTPDLKLWFTTWYQTRLEITRGTRADTDSCLRQNSRTICEWRFPILEAQRPGTWQLHLRKRSRPKTDVTVTVDFGPVR